MKATKQVGSQYPRHLQDLLHCGVSSTSRHKGSQEETSPRETCVHTWQDTHNKSMHTATHHQHLLLTGVEWQMRMNDRGLQTTAGFRKQSHRCSHTLLETTHGQPWSNDSFVLGWAGVTNRVFLPLYFEVRGKGYCVHTDAEGPTAHHSLPPRQSLTSSVLLKGFQSTARLFYIHLQCLNDS